MSRSLDVQGEMEFRLGSNQRVRGAGDVVAIPGGSEHEDWFREGTEVIAYWMSPPAAIMPG